jgi:hypothetical protein
MARSTTRKRRATLAGIALTLVLVAAGSLPALAGGYVAKTFTMNVTPTPVIAGTSRAFSVAIKNTSNISLGSINLTVPPLLTITSATASKGTVSQAANLVQVRTVGLAAGKSMTITVNAVAPCKTTTLTWYVMAMSGSNYTGTTFALDAAKSTKTTKVNGTCTIAFVAGRQPGSAHPNEVISSTDFNPSGDPIQVKVLDGSGNPSSFPASIALAIGSNPGSGTLGGTPTKTASGGVATFDDLTIDNPGVDYTLVGSSAGFASVTSGPFTIADENVPCVPDVDCIGDIDDGTTFANVNAKADPSATNLRISLLEGGPDCDGEDYIESTSTVEFSVSSGTRVKEVSISFDAGLGGSIEGSDPASPFQVCYESPSPFVDRHEATVTTGLLPDCDYEYPESTAPCVLSRIQGYGDYSSTWVTVTFLAPAGDPKGRV